VKKLWYLLRNRRYEGPFHLDDLNIKAQQGLLSPDDYLIDEENFTKGQMTYKKASELLQSHCFTRVLTAPEALHVTKSQTQEVETQVESYESGRAQESYKSSSKLSSVSNVSFQEGVSSFREWLSRLSFANVVTTFIVVLGAFWLFENNNNSGIDRQPADEAVETSVTQKRTVKREVVQRDYRNSPTRREEPVKRLMPTERPRAVVSPRPSVREGVGPDSPRFAQPQVLRDELRHREERGIASESHDGEFNNSQEEPYYPQTGDTQSPLIQDDSVTPSPGREPDNEDPVVESGLIDLPQDTYD
jgi:hypothetical protein